ncbi:hypothetical protein H920_06305 [Fukomys damarensis]|uniref:Uncharacterized protein n=1 Tax=Fukomys damarensis TaxID=885580 RepID=A0A091DPG9_FUKDA|nr:hypothetical protein H920_06305 [Fukomys damarensis]
MERTAAYGLSLLETLRVGVEGRSLGPRSWKKLEMNVQRTFSTLKYEFYENNDFVCIAATHFPSFTVNTYRKEEVSRDAVLLAAFQSLPLPGTAAVLFRGALVFALVLSVMSWPLTQMIQRLPQAFPPAPADSPASSASPCTARHKYSRLCGRLRGLLMQSPTGHRHGIRTPHSSDLSRGQITCTLLDLTMWLNFARMICNVPAQLWDSEAQNCSAKFSFDQEEQTQASGMTIANGIVQFDYKAASRPGAPQETQVLCFSLEKTQSYTPQSGTRDQGIPFFPQEVGKSLFVLFPGLLTTENSNSEARKPEFGTHRHSHTHTRKHTRMCTLPALEPGLHQKAVSSPADLAHCNPYVMNSDLHEPSEVDRSTEKLLEKKMGAILERTLSHPLGSYHPGGETHDGVQLSGGPGGRNSIWRSPSREGPQFWGSPSREHERIPSASQSSTCRAPPPGQGLLLLRSQLAGAPGP